MKQIFRYAIVSVFLFSCTKQEEKGIADANLEKKVDNLIHPYLEDQKVAGTAIAVFRNNEKVLLKSYGFADLEYDIKLPVNASFEIGSVTKQFTAAATLQLAEGGKLALDDDVTKFIAFNTKGKKVTIRHLLSHISGIKGYTELPVFGEIEMKKLDRDTLLRMVEEYPFDFEPGEGLIYSNTGFFMLGLIIEKVSGITYEDYVMKNLFQKAGMTHSYYCSESRVIKNRAHGYDTSEKGLVRAAYLDHTWPYSAGSLCSTAEDLVKWNDALHNGKILDSNMYQEFITPASLNDGTLTHYAKGITVTNKNGKRVFAHGGGINGFLSQNSYFPDEKVSIVVLANSTGPFSPGEIADRIGDFMFGIPSTEKHKFDGDLSKLTGTYKGRGRGHDLVTTVIKNESDISIQMGDDKPKVLNYNEDNTWTDGFSTYHFKGTADLINELRVDETYGYYVLKRDSVAL